MFERVKAFNAACDGSDKVFTGTYPDRLRLLRARLIYEEAKELSLELSNNTPCVASICHEAVDLLYVALGVFSDLGIDPEPFFAEVHAANMRKAPFERDILGKIVKPKGWKPADLHKVLDELHLLQRANQRG